MTGSRVRRRISLLSLVWAISMLLAAGPASAAATGQGLVTLLPEPEHQVPGSFLDLKYRIQPGSLQGPVDLYFAVRFPSGDLLFLSENGFVPGFEPFRREVVVVDETVTLLSFFFPVDLPFGTYTAFMGMAYAGTDASNSSNWASPIAQASVTYAALSPLQQSIIQSRGNPDLLAVFWLPEQHQKRESWVYLSSGAPTRYRFLNGNLESQEALQAAGSSAGPKVDPGQFSPHTTLDQLTATFGPPTSVVADEDLQQFQGVTYSFGLSVTLQEGRLSSAVTSLP